MEEERDREREGEKGFPSNSESKGESLSAGVWQRCGVGGGVEEEGGGRGRGRAQGRVMPLSCGNPCEPFFVCVLLVRVKVFKAGACYVCMHVSVYTCTYV